MICSKCSNPSIDDSAAVCDRCGSILCQSCSCLTATEMRALALSKRTIIFLCAGCRDGSSCGQPCSCVTSGEVRKIVSDAIEGLMADVRTRMDLGQETVRNHLIRLSGEIDVLKSSNVDLVRMFTNAPSGSMGGGVHDFSPGGSRLSAGRSLKKTNPLAAASSDSGAQRALSVPSVREKPSLSRRDGSGSAGDASGGTHSVAGASGVIQSGSCPPLHNPSVKKPMTGSYRRPTVIGSGKTAGKKISAAVIRKRTSVFVGRLATHVTPEDLDEYLRTTFNCEDNFKIEQLSVRSGSYNSFRIETDVSLLDQLFSAESWPEGVVIKKFRFFQPRKGTSSSQP